MMARHASYELLAEMIRRRFQNHREELRELFGRLTSNILCGNTDDHARNHATFWDGKNLRLTSAYDVWRSPRLPSWQCHVAGLAARSNGRSLQHFFNGKVTKVNIHTPAGLDAFVDHLDGGTPIILADMGAGAGQVAADWFESMYDDVSASHGYSFRK
jgi:hypothetical protein